MSTGFEKITLQIFFFSILINFFVWIHCLQLSTCYLIIKIIAF